MMEKGLLKEATALYPYREKTALQTVGYTELFKYMDGEWTLDFAVEEIKKTADVIQNASLPGIVKQMIYIICSWVIHRKISKNY